MTPQQLEQLLIAGENTCLEFKRCGGNPGADIFETFCAFLNRDGGDLLLGIADNAEVLGVPEQAADSIVRNLIKTMNDRNQLDPPFYVLPQILSFHGKKIIHLRVPRSSDVHRFKGICYDRVHEADVKVSATSQLALMYLRKQNVYTEQKIYPFVTLQELKPELFTLTRRLASVRNPEHPWLELSDQELLKSAGLYRRDYATGQEGICAAGILLLGRDDVIHDVFPTYKTDALIRITNIDRYDDRLTVCSNLFESYSQLIKFAEKWLPEKFFIENGTSISLRAKILREAVANLLIHREFTSSYVARLVIEKDRLVADNANRSCHLGNITPQNLTPQAKNPIIADFFKEIGRADELGSGVRNLFKYVKIYSGKLPELCDEDVFTLTIPLDSTYAPEGPSPANDVFWSQPATESTIDTLKNHILRLLKRNSSLSRQALAKAIGGTTPQRIRTAMNQLQGEGVIVRSGPAHGGQWLVVGN